MANRVRAAIRNEFDQYVYIWGDETNIIEFKNRYESFRSPLSTTLQQKQQGLLVSGIVGFNQYTSNWVPSPRNKFFVSKFDFKSARPRLP